MKPKILISVLWVIFISSCFGPRLVYNVGLSNVEAPTDAKKQYGETKIVTLEEESKSGFKYKDDYIDISWFVGSPKFSFTVKNKSEYSIKIPQYDVTYINTAGSVGRVMHSGVKYIDRNNFQPASIIPKGAFLSDIIQPTENVYYISGKYGGWNTTDLFNFKIDKTNIEVSKALYLGKIVRVLLPILIQDVCNEYVFEFKIDDIQTIK